MKCGILFSTWGSGPSDMNGCHLDCSHDGPHEFVASSGATYQWETDWACNCAECRKSDGDFCSIYWQHDAAAAQQNGGAKE